MPKAKSRKAVIARFKVTSTNKIKRRKPGLRHLLTGKSSNRKRHLRKSCLVNKAQTKLYRLLMGE